MSSSKAAKTRISYIIKDTLEASPSKNDQGLLKNDQGLLVSNTIAHRQGINALVLGYDHSGASSTGYLYSGGRDSLINKWSFESSSQNNNIHSSIGSAGGTLYTNLATNVALDDATNLGSNLGSNRASFTAQSQAANSTPIPHAQPIQPLVPLSSSSAPTAQSINASMSATTNATSNSPSSPASINSSLPYPIPRNTNASLKRLAHRDPSLPSSLPSLHNHLAHKSQPGRVSFNASSPFKQHQHDSYASSRPSGVSVEGIHHIPYDTIINYNKSILAPAPNTALSHSFTGHADWVNDLALRDQGRYLVSCSSDRTVVLWDTQNQDSDDGGNATKLGMHGDYVKRLAMPKMRNWVCSGGLDRQLLLWDLQESRPTQPQVIYTDDSPFGSVYALATNPTGSLIASGSAQKFISLFDPRAKSSQILQLQGHSNVIRDLLLSDDGKWVLSASSDTTIKLWCLAMPNHCITTYNHSDAPVWCLATTSPTFETFWAGAKDGWVYKVACSPQLDDDGRNVDCIALCKETHPVLKIAAIEDAYVWTATTSSSINRWPDIPMTMNPSTFQIPASSICRRESIEEPETESLYSRPVSIRSGMEGLGGTSASTHFAPDSSVLGMPARTASPELFEGGNQGDGEEGEELTPVWPAPVEVLRGVAGIRKSLLLNNKRHLLTQDTEDVVCVWDIICCCKIKTLGKVDFKEAFEMENPVEWVANWCTVQTNLGEITVHLDEGRCYDSEVYFQDLLPHAHAKNEDQRVNLAKWILTYLFYDHLKALYPSNTSFDPSTPKPVFNHGGKPQLQISLADSSLSEKGPETPSLKVMLATPVSATGTHPLVSLASMGSINSLPPPLFSNPSSISNNSSTLPSTANTNLASGTTSNENLNNADDSAERKTARSGSFISKFKNFRIRSGSSPKTSNDDGASSNSNLAATTLKSSEKLVERNEALIFFEECPFISLDPNTNVIFSVEESPSIFNDTFQARIGDMGHTECLPNLQTHLPWVHDWLLQGVNPPKDLAKLSFVLQKHSKSNLPEIPAETSRLTANRMLRIRKVIQYLCDKIACTPHPACIGSTSLSAPVANDGKSTESKKVYIELYCQGKLLNFRQTLATIKYCVCKTGGTDLVFQYLERKVREVPSS